MMKDSFITSQNSLIGFLCCCESFSTSKCCIFTKGYYFIILQQQKKHFIWCSFPKEYPFKGLKKKPLKSLYQLTVTYSSKEQPQTLRVLINILDVS